MGILPSSKLKICSFPAIWPNGTLSHLSICLRFMDSPIGWIFCYSCFLHGEMNKYLRASTSVLVPHTSRVRLRGPTLFSLLHCVGLHSMLSLDCSINLYSHQWALSSYPVQDRGTLCANCLGREAVLSKKLLSHSTWFVKGLPHLHFSFTLWDGILWGWCRIWGWINSSLRQIGAGSSSMCHSKLVEPLSSLMWAWLLISHCSFYSTAFLKVSSEPSNLVLAPWWMQGCTSSHSEHN